MLLVADSGSTKTNWGLVVNGEIKYFTTQGINPYFQSKVEITRIVIEELLPQNPKLKLVQSLYFYGAGISNDENRKIVLEGLKPAFETNNIEVEHDMLASARALCGYEDGIVCILGTGSNSCVFKNRNITNNIPALGFILGDEGSGAHLGKLFIRDFIYGHIQAPISDAFKTKFGLDKDKILHKVNREPLANRFLASFTEFLNEFRYEDYVQELVQKSFSEFLKFHVVDYAESVELPVHFTGSVAAGFDSELKDCCLSLDLQPGIIVKDPLELLIKYHQSENA